MTPITYIYETKSSRLGKIFRKICIFKIIDYLPCQCKIPIQNLFWPLKLYLHTIFKLFAGPIIQVFRSSSTQTFSEEKKKRKKKKKKKKKKKHYQRQVFRLKFLYNTCKIIISAAVFQWITPCNKIIMTTRVFDLINKPLTDSDLYSSQQITPNFENKYELPHGKTNNVVSITAKLICVFVFAYADCWFSHEAAHMFKNSSIR